MPSLTKYAELTDSTHHIALVEMLAQGMVAMFNPDTRRFVHVLNYPDLSVKEQFRIIYYDGEAAFALMRLYKITRRPVWLQAVELVAQARAAGRQALRIGLSGTPGVGKSSFIERFGGFLTTKGLQVAVLAGVGLYALGPWRATPSPIPSAPATVAPTPAR